jgi:membrane-associated phospholipid phosphatase
MGRGHGSSPALRWTVRAGAAATIGAAFAIPLSRKRRRIPAPVTIAACAAGPLAVAVLRPRTRSRDVVLFAMQMWGFTVVHELPYDDPEALERRLLTRYPIKIDRLLGGGQLPGVRLQKALGKRGGDGTLNRFLTFAHWVWFIEPYAALVIVLIRNPGGFPRAARQMAAVFDAGAAVYWFAPTAPPWWSSEEGLTGDEEAKVRRIMVEVGEPTWGRAWDTLYAALGGNPWAAMPSLHFATSLSAALSLSEIGPAEGTVGWAYALTLGFALVYLGEHYVTDLIAGSALVGAVRKLEPAAEPWVLRINARLQALERLASG